MRVFELSRLAGVVLAWGLILNGAGAQVTKLWTTDRFEDLEHGTTDGAAIRSDGRIEAGPAASLLTAAGGSFVWAVAPGRTGEVYAGVGGGSAASAALLKIAADGTSKQVWSGGELAVQAVRVADDGSVVFATNPDGKVYRLNASGAPTVLFDPAALPANQTDKPKYLWDLAVMGGAVYIATGAPAAVYRVELAGGSARLLFKTADQHIRCLGDGSGGILWAGSDGAGCHLQGCHP